MACAVGGVAALMHAVLPPCASWRGGMGRREPARRLLRVRVRHGIRAPAAALRHPEHHPARAGPNGRHAEQRRWWFRRRFRSATDRGPSRRGRLLGRRPRRRAHAHMVTTDDVVVRARSFEPASDESEPVAQQHEPDVTDAPVVPAETRAPPPPYALEGVTAPSPSELADASSDRRSRGSTSASSLASKWM